VTNRKPKVGDWAYHKSGFDPREVIEVSEDSTQIRLDILGVETPWLDTVNYNFSEA